MPTIQETIAALDELGRDLLQFDDELQNAIVRAQQENAWFTPGNIEMAIKAIAENYLNKEQLEKWVSRYDLKQPSQPKNVGLILAGNLPLVGFHDVLSVLITGHRALVKLSSKDTVLLQFILKKLSEINADVADMIVVADKLKDYDAVIATGSNNTNRYFEYYFGKKPHIFRKNRSSVAVLSGEESEDDIYHLGEDIFSYFGLGCRNVSKLVVPEGYEVQQLLGRLDAFQDIKEHHKYKNNYDYNLTILMMNREPHFANEFLCLRQSQAVSSPVAIMNYETYSDKEQLKEILKRDEEQIQVVVSSQNNDLPGMALGQAQHPKLWDYADKVDTVEFLIGL